MKFSRILASFLVVASVSGCAYVIPPEQNAPRHNTVVGEPRKPQLNGKTLGPRSAIAAPVMPVARNEVPNLPPVDEATQNQANKEMAAQAAVAPIPPVTAATPVANGRRVPLENAQFQVSENTYPTLSEVPPRPVTEGPGSVKERLNNTQAELEQSRDASNISKEALARDAAAEPSLLPLPATNTPAATSVPVVTPSTASAPASVSVPPRETIRQAPVNNRPAAALMPAPVQTVAKIAPTVAPAAVNVAPVQAVAVAAPRIVMPVTTAVALPNTPTFAPPAPMRGTASAYVPQAMPAPVAAVVPHAAPQQSIALARPVASAPVIASQDLVAPAASANAAAIRPTVRRGDFDPLAVADNAPIATTAPAVATYSAVQARTSSSYMATSRYADRRY